MRHSVFGNQLGRRTNAAKGLFRSLLVAVLEKGQIQTTRAKAKAIQGDLDKLINLGKQNTLAARHNAIKIMGNDRLLENLFGKLALRFSDRNSGFSRIIQLGERYSDTAEMVILQLVGEDKIVPKVEDKTETAKTQNKVKAQKRILKKPKTLK